MKLSVVIPHYNQPNALETCVGSLLAQSRSPDEIVVVDDGSTVDLPHCGFARFLRQPRHPCHYAQWATNVNRGVQGSSGDGIVLISCHWLLAREYLSGVEKLLEGCRSEKIVWCSEPPNARYDSEGGLLNVDNDTHYVLRRSAWVPWDERFDAIGGVHQVPAWGIMCRKVGVKFCVHPVLTGINRQLGGICGTEEENRVAYALGSVIRRRWTASSLLLVGIQSGDQGLQDYAVSGGYVSDETVLVF